MSGAKGGCSENDDIGWQRREVGSGKCWLWLTEGGRGVWLILTLLTKMLENGQKYIQLHMAIQHFPEAIWHLSEAIWHVFLTQSDIFLRPSGTILRSSNTFLRPANNFLNRAQRYSIRRPYQIPNIPYQIQNSMSFWREHFNSRGTVFHIPSYRGVYTVLAGYPNF